MTLRFAPGKRGGEWLRRLAAPGSAEEEALRRRRPDRPRPGWRNVLERSEGNSRRAAGETTTLVVQLPAVQNEGFEEAVVVEEIGGRVVSWSSTTSRESENRCGWC